MPDFFAFFQRVHLWSIKGVYLFQNTNVLTLYTNIDIQMFYCFIGCLHISLPFSHPNNLLFVSLSSLEF